MVELEEALEQEEELEKGEEEEEEEEDEVNNDENLQYFDHLESATKDDDGSHVNAMVEEKGVMEDDEDAMMVVKVVEGDKDSADFNLRVLPKTMMVLMLKLWWQRKRWRRR